MKRSVLKGFARHGARLAVLLVFLSVVAVVSHSQASGAAAQPATMAAIPASRLQTTSGAVPARGQTANTGEKTEGGMHQGIKIHGHWVIEIRNPDGTLVAHREFENKLEGLEGGQLIMSLLGGVAVKGQWMVALSVPCSSADFCVLGETGLPAPQTVPIAPDLTSAFGGASSLNCQSAPAGTCPQTLGIGINSPIGTVQLIGSVVAANAGSIGAVETALQECYGSNSTYPTVTVAACTQIAPNNPQYFTGTTLTPAQSFIAGQTIIVTVTISFQ
ncbi:MAG: hypothetical protein WCC24_10705 [Terracidiphilus sp.]